MRAPSGLALVALLLLGGCLAEPTLPTGGAGPTVAIDVVARGETNTSFLSAWAATPSRAWFGGQGGVVLGWDGQRYQAETVGVTETIAGLWGAAICCHPVAVCRAM